MNATTVMAGLVPAIPIREALPPKRDARYKPGHDSGEFGAYCSTWMLLALMTSPQRAISLLRMVCAAATLR